MNIALVYLSSNLPFYMNCQSQESESFNSNNKKENDESPTTIPEKCLIYEHSLSLGWSWCTDLVFGCKQVHGFGPSPVSQWQIGGKGGASKEIRKLPETSCPSMWGRRGVDGIVETLKEYDWVQGSEIWHYPSIIFELLHGQIAAVHIVISRLSWIQDISSPCKDHTNYD